MNFSEGNHEYTKNGIRYMPVSEFLAKFEKPFEKEIIATKYAEKNGRAKEEVLAQWELNADISCQYGIALHKAIEYWIQYGEITKISHLKLATEKFAAKFDRKIIRPEIIVDNDQYRIAGTIDQLHFVGKKKVKITDIKTNGELTDKAKGYFLAPIADLPCSKINKYRLQLSAYKHFLELKGFEVVSIELEHWNGEDYKTIPLEPIDIQPLLNTLN